MALRVSLAGAGELELVHRIMIEAFAEYRGRLEPPSSAHDETLADVERAILEGGAVLAREGSAAVGSARFRLRPDHSYIERVAVLPSHRGRGIAGAMMRFLEEEALRRGLFEAQVGIRVALPRNRALYERLGYRLAKVEQHPRGGPGDLVATLVKTLAPSAARSHVQETMA